MKYLRKKKNYLTKHHDDDVIVIDRQVIDKKLLE